MAEVVFQNLEGMLPELEELEKQGVFNREELRIIIKRRTDFEYKLQKRVMEKQDVLNYLEYELKLNLLQKKRSKRLKLKLYSTATQAVSRRIHALFREKGTSQDVDVKNQKGLMKFGDDMKLWMQYIDFCKKTDSTRALGLAFGKLIQKHASNPEVWLMAAKHEFEDVNNAENARSLMQRALRNHKENKKLWLEYFRLELLHVEKIKKRRQVLGIDGIEVKETDDSDPKEMELFLSNKTALIVFQNALKQIEDVEFALDFIEICQPFDGTDDLEDTLYTRIKETFPSDEAMYTALAKRPISRLKKHTDQVVTDEMWLEAENEMEEQFQEALEKFNTDCMWEKCVTTYSELLQDSSSPKIAETRMHRIFSTLKSAEENKHMTESMYELWSDLLLTIDENTEAETCLDRALAVYKANKNLWQKYLVLKAESIDSWADYKCLFKKCLSNLKNLASQEIWEMFIEAAKSVNEEETKAVFEAALSSDKETRDEILPQYLDWVADTTGLKAARKLYTRIFKEFYPYNFLIKCLEIESREDDIDVKRVRLIYEKLIDKHGKTDEDVWLDYIQFEKIHCGTEIERPGLLYTKAKRTLEGKHNSEFLTKYSIMNDES